MNSRSQKLTLGFAILVFSGFMTFSALGADSKPQTFTGEVSDSMCGASHMMEGSKAQCTHACISKGSKYALVVGDKVYTLESGDKDSLDQLSKLAGEQAKVSGVADGDSIQVRSLSSAK
ncbi:MAG: hypothetical protein M3O09_07290 [Acidobacteriota bacterium]|nr:hypothetical protein [Acidobacteriota bacterium]